MPSLGAGMTVGRLVEWLVAPGETLHRGDLIATVETDKADIDVEVWEDGILAELLVEEGAKVPVGTPLARLTPLGEGVAAPAAPAAQPAEVAEVAEVGDSGPVAALQRNEVEEATASGRRRQRVSPYARRLARDAGRDPTTLPGSGPDGAVVARDLRDGATTDAGATAAPGSSVRTAIARAMTIANREIPHYHLGTTVDVTGTTVWLADRNVGRPPRERILLAAVELRAVALALRDHPELNGHWRDDRFVPAAAVDLCVAIALRGGGLLTPAIPAADTLDLDELMAALRDLVRRTRDGGLRGQEMAGGSATVTNLGELGVETVHGIISPPQVALVGFGRPVQRPWVVDGDVVVREVVEVTLAADHRQSDGAAGSRFLRTVAAHLEHPEAA